MTDETNGPADAPEIPVEVAAEPVDRATTLEQEKKELHERLLRTAADFDNYRKRSRKEVDDARAKGREETLREMLPVLDNLERALGAAQAQGGAGGGITEGVQLVLRQFASALERFDVKAVSALGEAFDPSRHEAIAQVPTADAKPGTVVSEMQKGYSMGGRLIRPAMVAVASAPAAPAADAPAATPENDEKGE